MCFSKTLVLNGSVFLDTLKINVSNNFKNSSNQQKHDTVIKLVNNVNLQTCDTCPVLELS